MTPITKESLIEFGMIETDDPICPLKKVISLPKEEQDSPDSDDLGEMAICISRMRNATDLCLMLPDGGTLYLVAESIEQLKTFEECIASFEPVW